MRIFIIAVCFLCFSCKPKQDHPQSKNASLPPLPVATEAETIQGEQIYFIEVQHTDTGWNIDGGISLTDEEETIEQLTKFKRQLQKNGQSPRILIEADAATPFKSIRHIVRMAAAAGVNTIMFASKSDASSPDTIGEAHQLTLASATRCGSAPVIEPMFIKVGKMNEVLINHGAAQEMVDGSEVGETLPGITDRLEMFCAACQAGAVEPRVNVWVVPEASYQRFISVLDAIKRNGIHFHQVAFVDRPNEQSSGTDCSIPHRGKLPPPPRPSRKIPPSQYPGAMD